MDAETDDLNGKSGCCGGGTAQADGAQLPEKIQRGKGGSFNKNLCPLGLLAFVVVLILGLWLLVGGAGRDPLLALIPAAANRAEIYNCSAELREKIAELPLWAKPETAGAALADGVLRLEFAPALQGGEWKKIFPFVSRVARVFTAQGEFYLLESVKGGSGNGWDIERILSQEVAHGFVKDRDTVAVGGSVPARKLDIPGVGVVYALRDGNYLALSRSQEMIAAVVDCKLGKARSLADIDGVAQAESTQSALLVRYVAPAQANLLFPGVDENAFRPESAVLSVVRPAADGLLMASTVVDRGDAANPAEHGFFYYVGMTILLILSLVIGLPALFLLTTLLLAGYFYLMAWWRGEVVPLEPYELPELSKQMKEDLGGDGAAGAKNDPDGDRG